MLGEPGDRVTELVGALGLLRDFAEHLRRRLVRFPRTHQVEDAEFHRVLLLSVRSWHLRSQSKAAICGPYGTPSARSRRGNNPTTATRRSSAPSRTARPARNAGGGPARAA